VLQAIIAQWNHALRWQVERDMWAGVGYLWSLHYGVEDAVGEHYAGAAFRRNAEENSSETEQRKQQQCRTSRRPVYNTQTSRPSPPSLPP